MKKPANYGGVPSGHRTYPQFIRFSFAILGLLLSSTTSNFAQEAVQPILTTEVQNTLNQVIVRWETNASTAVESYVLYRKTQDSSTWEEVLSCEHYDEMTYYAYRDTEVGKQDEIQYRLETTGPAGLTTEHPPVVARMTPYSERLSYRVDIEAQTISFFGGFVEDNSTVILMDLQGARFEFLSAYVDDELTMDAIELPDGKYTYTVASGNQRRSGNVQYNRQLLEEVPGAFAFEGIKDE